MTNSADADADRATVPTDARLPEPGAHARWRWTTPRKAVVAGGVLAALFGIGLGIGAGTAGAATSGSGTHAGSGAGPAPPGGRPTVAGKITALDGDQITVHTRKGGTVTVVYAAGTTFTELAAGGGGTTSSSASALKVGEYVGVQGTKSNSTVTARRIVVSTTAPPGPGGGPSGGPPASA
jgi:hypothetical protein